MEAEAKAETKVEPETAPVTCKFTGYLNEAGEIVIDTETDECRRLVVEAGKAMGVKVGCGPCKEVARRFVASMQAKKIAMEAEPPPVSPAAAAAAAAAAPVTEPEPAHPET
ncbi:hypothetical protein ES708_26707 [subsurface metagenome]